MARWVLPLALTVVLALAPLTRASAFVFFVVENTNDSGVGSLREAINGANSSAGADAIIFDATLSGKTIYPLTPLPALSDSATYLDGDIDGNGSPDVTIDGRYLGADQDGLTLSGHPGFAGCTVNGLAIVRCPRHGIYVFVSHNNRIQGCHLGVNRAGTAAVLNGACDINIYGSDGNVIGGDAAKQRNIIAGGNPVASLGAGVALNACTTTQVRHNHFGLNRAGTAAIAGGDWGVWVGGGSANTIGGGGAKYRNLFGTSEVGVLLRHDTHGNVVAGNCLGLAKDGSTAIPIGVAGVALESGAHDNTIGGTSAGACNVFAGQCSEGAGVTVAGAETSGNRVQGNYFGLTAAGTAKRALACGVACRDKAPGTVVGGNAPGARNHFCSTIGVSLDDRVTNSVVRSNTFGVRPAGGAVTGITSAVEVCDVGAVVVANTVANAYAGFHVRVVNVFCCPRVTGNSFSACERAVWLDGLGAAANVGNLSNASTTDDGGNVFSPTNTWHVYSQSRHRIKAEGNDFGTTVRSEIDAKIYDHRDDTSLGRVDFDPLLGGVHPTGEAGAALALAGASAASSAAGAEIAFMLSAPAGVTVTVLNLAGRPIATPAADREMGAGVQRLSWNGQSREGLRAPNGAYLVRVAARSPGGGQVQTLVPLRLQRP
ncbi:MAG: hypothetical protein FJX75_17640 [Armatimonadetes bacterium]|nr:hypothetical protein [Armatimonadota bacterium]